MSIPGLNSVGVEPWSKISERDVSQERRGCEWKQEKKDATLHRGWKKVGPDTPTEWSLDNLGHPPTSGAPWRTQTCPSLAWTLWGLNLEAKFQKGMSVKREGDVSESKRKRMHRGWNKGDPDTPIERSLCNLRQPPSSGAPWRTQTCQSLAWTLWGWTLKQNFSKGCQSRRRGCQGCN